MIPSVHIRVDMLHRGIATLGVWCSTSLLVFVSHPPPVFTTVLTGMELVLKDHSGAVRGLAITKDGLTLVTVSDDKTCRCIAQVVCLFVSLFCLLSNVSSSFSFILLFVFAYINDQVSVPPHPFLMSDGVFFACVLCFYLA